MLQHIAITDGGARATSEGDNGLERLRALMRAYAIVMTGDMGRVTILTSEFDLSEISKRKFRRIKREVDQMVRAQVVEGMEDGSIAKGDAKLVTFTLTGALNWIARWYDPRGPLSVEDVTNACVETLIAGVAPREGKR